MIVLTSIAPKHHHENAQMNAVKSWIKHGFTVVSLNAPNEIELLETKFHEIVKFVPTNDHQHAMYGKPLVTINAICDFVRSVGEPVLFINSDCMLADDIEPLKQLFQMSEFGKKSMVYLHRWNFNSPQSPNDCHLYKMGIDAVLYHPDIIPIIPRTEFCLGQTYWDLMVPYWHIMAGVEIMTNKEKPIILHHDHPAQYKPQEWDRLGRYAGILTGRPGYKPGDVSQFLYNIIFGSTKYIS